MSNDFRINNLPVFLRRLGSSAGTAINDAAGDGVLTEAESAKLPSWLKDNFANFTANASSKDVPASIFAASYMGWAAETLMSSDGESDGVVYASELPAGSDMINEAREFGEVVPTEAELVDIPVSEIPSDIVSKLHSEVDTNHAEEVIYSKRTDENGEVVSYRIAAGEFLSGPYDGFKVSWAEVDTSGQLIDSGSEIQD